MILVFIIKLWSDVTCLYSYWFYTIFLNSLKVFILYWSRIIKNNTYYNHISAPFLFAIFIRIYLLFLLFYCVFLLNTRDFKSFLKQTCVWFESYLLEKNFIRNFTSIFVQKQNQVKWGNAFLCKYIFVCFFFWTFFICLKRFVEKRIHLSSHFTTSFLVSCIVMCIFMCRAKFGDANIK